MFKTLTADELNRECACRTLDIGELRQILDKKSLIDGFYDQLMKTHPHIFAETVVFISQEKFTQIAQIIADIEKTIHSDQFKSLVLPAHQFAPATAGVCMGYDFHLTDAGPKLIEINTNAGGLLLNLDLARAQNICCGEMNGIAGVDGNVRNLENAIYEMFLSEWKLQGRQCQLETIAIVDENPKSQYLYPEFQLYVELFKKFGISAFIVDPTELTVKDDKVYFQSQQIDLIYNRLTDFYLSKNEHQYLKYAYENDLVVMSPAPHHYMLYAQKSNLEILCQNQSLQAAVPLTRRVKAELFESLWNNRKHLFFKPVSGFGSRAAYRGDKITKRVWDEICQGDYVAQEIALPSSRIVEVGSAKQKLKLDLRCYTYQGKIQLMAARLYDGQTTNFRTNGGGFASVFLMPN